MIVHAIGDIVFIIQLHCTDGMETSLDPKLIPWGGANMESFIVQLLSVAGK